MGLRPPRIGTNMWEWRDKRYPYQAESWLGQAVLMSERYILFHKLLSELKISQ